MPSARTLARFATWCVTASLLACATPQALPEVVTVLPVPDVLAALVIIEADVGPDVPEDVASLTQDASCVVDVGAPQPPIEPPQINANKPFLDPEQEQLPYAFRLRSAIDSAEQLDAKVKALRNDLELRPKSANKKGD